MDGKLLLKKKRLYKETFDYLSHKYETRPDKNNLYGVGIDEKEFVDIITREFLGKDFYIVDPLGHSQALEYMLYEILEKYSPKFKDKGV